MLNYLLNVNLMYTVPNDKLTSFLVKKALSSPVKCANQASADYLEDVSNLVASVRQGIKDASQIQPNDLIGVELDSDQDITFI